MGAKVIPLNDLGRAANSESGAQLRDLMTRVLESGNYILGTEVSSFEQEFASYLGVGHVTSVSSGTDALVIALRSLGVGKGTRVVLTPNAGGYTTTALLEIGAAPIFVDCDEMGRMDPVSLDSQLKAIGNVGCVVATHLYGLSSNIKAVVRTCANHGVKLLEDCAQAAGGAVGEDRLGSFGDAATFSFYPTKNLGAIGDAGAISTNSDELAQQHKALRQYGWSSKYVVGTVFGKNSRMDELQASILRFRLAKLDELNGRRQQIWKEYASAVDGSTWKFIGDSSNEFVAHLGILTTPRGLRDAAARFLEERGVATSIHYPVVDYLQPGWRHLIAGDCPNAEDLSERILTVPLFPELTAQEVELVCSALTNLTSEMGARV
ncbi:MAG: DegT/DnrJ/EryC1/StrS family aminotransferase [Euryarchaeota archaeon]|nr:DegT/DnrJ/EryC1/StrS family aminotransferase [Euryarchaeota archaeon]